MKTKVILDYRCSEYIAIIVAIFRSFNNCKTKILVLLKELKIIHFVLPKGGYYVNFGDFAYLFFRKYNLIQDLSFSLSLKPFITL